MHGDVEICQQSEAWQIGIEGANLLQGSYRTLEEAIEVAWGMAAVLKVALSVGKERGDGGSAGGSHDALRPVTA
jgi:hypothetical protein